MKGRIKKFFPGGNTCLGFYSFFDYILDEGARRLFIIKGEPGVGKSTFMRSIGEAMRDLGLDVEFHYCSSDVDSLDGVVIPSLKIGLVDGTFPHVVDPRYPGLREEIVDLGAFRDDQRSEKHRKEIVRDNEILKKFYQLAYNNLKEAWIIREEWKLHIKEARHWPSFYRAKRRLLGDVFQDSEGDSHLKERHLFAGGIIPAGWVRDNISTLLWEVERIFLLRGEPGSGGSLKF